MTSASNYGALLKTKKQICTTQTYSKRAGPVQIHNQVKLQAKVSIREISVNGRKHLGWPPCQAGSLATLESC